MIKLILLDVDGVMTDGKKQYDKDGTVILKTFCDKDWTAIKRFRALGIDVAFLSGDGFNANIAKNRNIPFYLNRSNGKHSDKVNFLDEICLDFSVTSEEIVYVGDDIFDVRIANAVGFPFCPSDAVAEMIESCSVLTKRAGDNVVMTLFEELQSRELLPKFYFDGHLDDVYTLDEKEKF
jgi:3-deoxy-D-manno-octulosonate 8-phosphate phosphatase (KDO 8-P phosphatase)